MNPCITNLFPENYRGTCVEVGASSGGPGNPSDYLMQRGWRGIWIEFDDRKFAEMKKTTEAYGDRLVAIHSTITADNVVPLLEGHVPDGVDYFVLDIDGWDAPVLDEIMQTIRPLYMEVEINEKIPYPVEFFVHYNPAGQDWKGDHFYGMSLRTCEILSRLHGYTILNAFSMNVLLCRDDIYEANAHDSVGMRAIVDIVKTYALAAYFNHDVYSWYNLSPNDAAEAIRNYYVSKGHSEDRFTVRVK